MTGRGVQASVGGATVAVGGPALLRELGVAEPAGLAAQVAGWRGRGATLLFVVRDGQVLGPWPSRTPCGPSRAGPSPSCTASASGW